MLVSLTFCEGQYMYSQLQQTMCVKRRYWASLKKKNPDLYETHSKGPLFSKIPLQYHLYYKRIFLQVHYDRFCVAIHDYLNPKDDVVLEHTQCFTIIDVVVIYHCGQKWAWSFTEQKAWNEYIYLLYLHLIKVLKK